MNFKHECSPENALLFHDWILNRGGVAVWSSINLSNPGATWSTPANNTDGSPTTKPTWQADSVPSMVITDPHEIAVITGKEVKRFHVGVKRGYGLSFVLTDAASRRVRKAVEDAGEGSWYVFDYDRQNAVIMAPSVTMSLDSFMTRPASA